MLQHVRYPLLGIIYLRFRPTTLFNPGDQLRNALLNMQSIVIAYLETSRVVDIDRSLFYRETTFRRTFTQFQSPMRVNTVETRGIMRIYYGM